jgi:hypothetical protein
MVLLRVLGPVQTPEKNTAARASDARLRMKPTQDEREIGLARIPVRRPTRTQFAGRFSQCEKTILARFVSRCGR